MKSEPACTLNEFEIAIDALEAAGIHTSRIGGKIVKKLSLTRSVGRSFPRLIFFVVNHLREHNVGGAVVDRFQFSPLYCPEPDIAYISQHIKPINQICISDVWSDFIINVIDESLPQSDIEQRARDRATWV